MNPFPDDLILFDGVCNLCSGFVQFVIRHDRKGIFRFASIQSRVGQEIYRMHHLDPANFNTFLVISRGKVLVRSDASIEILRRFGGLWKAAVLLKLFPRALRDWVYRFISRYRYQWFGKKETCMVPSDETKAKFLE